MNDLERFNRAFDLVIGHEGKLSLRRSDHGNWTGGKVGSGELKGTKYGISAMTYPHLDIRNLSLEKAKEIYYEDFWLDAGCDELPAGIAYGVFDAQINTGRGVKFLQMAVGTRADGDWGPASRRAFEAMAGRMGVEYIIRDQSAHRMWHYMKLDHMDDEYGLGWARRGLDVDRKALEFHKEAGR